MSSLPPAQVFSPYNEAEMRRVSVARAHRRHGVAQLLVYTALELAQHVFGYHAVHLSTAESMASAVRFYLRTGFAVAYSRIGCGDTSQWPCVHFRWPLGAVGRQLGPLRDIRATTFYELDYEEFYGADSEYASSSSRYGDSNSQEKSAAAGAVDTKESLSAE